MRSSAPAIKSVPFVDSETTQTTTIDLLLLMRGTPFTGITSAGLGLSMVSLSRGVARLSDHHQPATGTEVAVVAVVEAVAAAVAEEATPTLLACRQPSRLASPAAGLALSTLSGKIRSYGVTLRWRAVTRRPSQEPSPAALAARLLQLPRRVKGPKEVVGEEEVEAVAMVEVEVVKEGEETVGAKVEALLPMAPSLKRVSASSVGRLSPNTLMGATAKGMQRLLRRWRPVAETMDTCWMRMEQRSRSF